MATDEKSYTVDSKIKLLMDGPLGKLTRWMRMMGYYCYYDPKLTSSSIIKLAKKYRLFLFTTSLNTGKQAKSSEIAYIIVTGKTILEQVKSLKTNNIQIKIPDINNSRCSICNGDLRIISNKNTETIPKKSLEHYDKFFKCLKCDQIYWEGSHWQRIKDTIKSVLV